MSDKRHKLASSRRVVVKIGSALLTNDGKGLDRQAMASWVKQMAALRQQGIEIVLVSSGAVAEGVVRQGLAERPERLPELQAAAAIGQMGLVQAYESEFNQYGISSAQILLVHDDLTHVVRFNNARETLKVLLGWQAIPIVNENDTVATDELKFGDNDTLAAMVANIVEADTLIILTDQDAMYDADPRKVVDAKVIHEAEAGDEALLVMAGDGGKLGRGGMSTKVKAADLAACTGADTVIVGGRIDRVLERVIAGECLGTLLYSNQQSLADRKAWFESLRA